LIVLSPAERSALKARAHRLGPVVLLGDKGLSEAALIEIDRSLRAHELIKIRVAEAGRRQRDALLEEICRRLEAAPVQHIGRMLVVYRPRAEEPPSASPRRRARPPARLPKRSFQNR
jgi:RNA-binding protein